MKQAMFVVFSSVLLLFNPSFCPGIMIEEGRTVSPLNSHDDAANVLASRDTDRGTLIHDRLDNGMQLLVMEVPSATVAYGMIAVRVGARYEGPDNGGIAHLLEHLLFREQGEAENLSLIRSSGGTVNALTDMELTSYYFTVLPQYFENSMGALARLVLEPQFDRDDLEREREVVLEELAMGMNDPRAVVLMQLVREIFPGSPLNSFVIGTEESIESIRYEQIAGFFHTHYVPENMVVVVAGKVESLDTLRFLRSVFGDIRPEPVPPHHFSVPSPAMNTVVKKIPIKQCFYIFGALTPGKGSERYQAMEVLHALLVSGVNSRLHRRLVLERGYTEQLYPQWFSYSNTGIWAVFLSVRPEDIVPVSALIADEVEAVKRGAFSHGELEVVKEGLVSRARISLVSPEDLAWFQLENLVYRNRVMTVSEYVEGLRSVTGSDIMEAARFCFSEESVVTIEMKPARGLERLYLILKYLTTKSL